MDQSKNNEVRHQKTTSQTSENSQKNANLSNNQEKSTEKDLISANNKVENNQEQQANNSKNSDKNSNLKKLPNSKDAKRHMIISALIFIALGVYCGMVYSLYLYRHCIFSCLQKCWRKQKKKRRYYLVCYSPLL